MNLSSLSGNARVKEQLSQQERGRGLAHAYLISGPAGSGKGRLARLLAQAMLCHAPGEKPCGQCGPCRKVEKGLHPDVSIVTGGAEGKPIAVDRVRQLRSDVYVRPNEGERKVYVLERADQMNASAQNAMLKVLEEGPPYAAFLLLAENSGGVLETVRSRCEELALLPAEAAVLEGEQAAAVCKMAGALERAGELELLEAAMEFTGRKSREELFALLDGLEVELGRRTVEGGDRRRLLRGVELVKKLREAAHLNVNGNQISGWLCAGMFEQE